MHDSSGSSPPTIHRVGVGGLAVEGARCEPGRVLPVWNHVDHAAASTSEIWPSAIRAPSCPASTADRISSSRDRITGACRTREVFQAARTCKLIQFPARLVYPAVEIGNKEQHVFA